LATRLDGAIFTIDNPIGPAPLSPLLQTIVANDCGLATLANQLLANQLLANQLLANQLLANQLLANQLLASHDHCRDHRAPVGHA